MCVGGGEKVALDKYDVLLGRMSMPNTSLSEIPPINHTPFLIPGADGPRTVIIEELKERTKVIKPQLDIIYGNKRYH